ncbi:hypothetical protein [Sulfurimonas paralvinellae]|uniref:Uncharacterized protein n=1 Tax=Sulfurimonas paralvinellae TaxID=317658 RepID=A0A7M1BAB2_9BACT|nr:hypothetical protein [Sulfurimonas paralvinellae]QOP46561.1 hypothetical protein FM071_09770 [Sulfurimonas paralvinellae]
MKKGTLLFFVLFMGVSGLQAKSTAEELKAKHVQEQMQKEKRFAKEQKFYQGKEYNLSEQKVDPNDLDSIPDIKPDYDFDMTDVYRDDI